MFKETFPIAFQNLQPFSEEKLPWLKEIISKTSKEFKDALLRRYSVSQGLEVSLRLSSLGKLTARDIAKRYFSTTPPITEEVDSKLNYLFWVGDQFEIFVYALLQMLGYELVDYQKTVTFRGILGHIDFLVRDPYDGELFVLDTKTAKDRMFDIYRKELHDDYGYITQIGCYVEALKQELGEQVNGYFLFTDKNDQRFHVAPVTEECYKPRVKRISDILDILDNSACLEETFGVLAPYPPSVMLKGGEPYFRDGKEVYYVPACVKEPDLHYIWHDGYTHYGTKQRIVTGYYYPDCIPLEERLTLYGE
jgi:hypothetical protein